MTHVGIPFSHEWKNQRHQDQTLLQNFAAPQFGDSNACAR